MAISQEFQTALNAYAAHLKATYVSMAPGGKDGEYEIEFEEGNKFVRIVHVGRGHRSAHSFIVKADGGKFKAGDILKTASWASPAKNFRRGNVLAGDMKRAYWAGVN